MSTNFPTSLDTLTNPSASDPQNSPSHSAQHANSNDAIEALEAKLGADGSAVTTSHDYKLSEILTTDKAVGKTATQDLTNKTVNGVTPTAGETGFTIAGGTTPKTLTVPLDASVSGTNTGDNAANTQYSGLAASKQDADADLTALAALTSPADKLDLAPTDLKISTASKGGVFNGGFELAPPFTAVQTQSNWIDGTATGSATNVGYGVYATHSGAGDGALSFDTTESYSGNKCIKLEITVDNF